MASTRLYRTNGTPTNDKIFTVSGWFKFHSTSGHVIFCGPGSNNTSWTQVRFSSDSLELSSYSTNWVRTTQKFRDFSAWYHIVITCDSTQSTAADRIKWWVNGQQITSFSVDNRSSTSLNQSWGWNKSGGVNNIGGENASGYGDFSVANFYNIDGTAYQASDFGETDSTTGIWKPKLSPTLNYGNNGFFLNFQDTTNFGDDTSGNGNDLTTGGTMTQTIDTPSNNFATLNPIDNATAVDFTLSNGNTTLGDNGSGDNDKGLRATLGVSSGKYYWEIKKLETGGTIGILGSEVNIGSGDVVNNASSNSYHVGSNGSSSNIVYWQNGNFVNSSALQGWAANDIMGVALDMDNGKLFLSINGVFKGFDNNTSDPANGTNANFTGIATDGTIFIPYAEKRGTANPSDNFNFGNGYFGTTAVSSAGTNTGIGTFEYDVPSGFKALCTKNINAQEYS